MLEKVSVLFGQGFVEYVSHSGEGVKTIAEAARTSTGKGSLGFEKDLKLARRLYKDRHDSPFEQLDLVVDMFIPLGILRELDRHRTLSKVGVEIISSEETFRCFTERNELSGRYVQLKDEFYIPPAERFVQQNTTNAQGSGEPLSLEDQKKCFTVYQQALGVLQRTRTTLYELGVANEVARMLTPWCQMTKVRIKASCLNWLKFLSLRQSEHAQWEIQEYANGVAQIIEHLWPEVYELYLEHTRHARTLSQGEYEKLQAFLAQPDIQERYALFS